MTPAAAPIVGIIGLGRMGSAMASALAARHEVLGWDVREVAGTPATLVATPAELAERCDLVLLSLPSPTITRRVLLESDFREPWQAGSCVVADTSTSDPQSHLALIAALGGAGERLLDAPILGRPDSCGRWTIPVGGSARALERARPALETLASRVLHVGGPGRAFGIKLLNNMMFAAINVITAEVLGAATRIGIAPEQFVEVVESSSAATVSPLFRDLAPRMLGEARDVVFTVELLQKDLQLAVKMCEAAGVPLISARALQIAVSRGIEAGLSESDTSALVRIYQEQGRA